MATLGLAACSRSDAAYEDFNNIDLRGAELTIARPLASAEPILTLSVKIADTIPSRQKGLMGVRALPPESGMVFPFETPVGIGFYMKNTLIPLDIAFWGPGRRIIAILQMAPCKDDPCPLHSPGQTYVGALEVNRGVLAKNGVRVGDLVELAP